MSAWGQGYVGEDRRDWAARPPGLASHRGWGLFAVAAILTAAILSHPLWRAPGAMDVVRPVTAVGVIVLTAIAAAACVMHWRMARDAPAALLANALIMLIVAATTSLVASDAYGSTVAAGDVLRTVHAILTVTACAFIVRAVRHAHIDTHLRPGRSLAAAAVASAVAVIALTRGRTAP